MPKRVTTGSGFARSALLKVEEAGRIRIPSDLVSDVSWMSGASESVECRVLQGPRSSLILVSEQMFEEAARTLPTTPFESKSPPTDTQVRNAWRAIALSYASTLQFEGGGRWTFPFSKPLLEVGFGERPQGYVFVLVLGNTIEIWSTDSANANTNESISSSLALLGI